MLGITNLGVTGASITMVEYVFGDGEK